VPLLVEERTTGVLVVDSRKPRSFDAAELRFLQLMANQAAIALETARLHQEEIQRQRIEEELAVGRHIQLSMLPSACPIVPHWDLAAVYEAAQQVGGDFYDFIQTPELPGHLGVVIADVSGKGVPAALFMALSRTIIRNAALQGLQPADTLIQANYFIQENSRADMFLTAFCATLDINSGLLTYASAGHDRPLWWQADQGHFEELDSGGMILGMLEDVELEERSASILPLDFVIFYTDGVTEAMNGDTEEYGKERLQAVIAGALSEHSDSTALEILQSIQDDVQTFTAGTPPSDDFTLIVLKRDS
jgi:sigma-B regulation protein RsbU (phosphoserine phosphatase)